MRAANLIIVILGIIGLGSAVVIAWLWRSLPLLAERQPAAESRSAGALDGLHTLAVTMSAGVLAGVLVPGFGGRLVMRILGATSSSAQGQRTAANEIVGEITNGGTVGVIVFVGILGGVVTALGFLVVRRWLPTNAGPAGLVVGVLLLGTIGVSDAMSPDNKDFAILRPTWLAVTLVVTLALLFGVTFTAIAARLDAGIPRLGTGPSSVVSHVALVFYLFPVLLVGAAIYITAKATSHGRLAPLLMSTRVRRVGHFIVGGATVGATVSSVLAISEIVTA